MASTGERGRASRARSIAAAVLGLLLVGGLPGVARAADPVAFRIADARITESSGLARDVAGGLYWTVNDSGSPGVLFGLGDDGSLRGTLNYRALPIDVEAVAMQGNRLYVADIGDNGGSREVVTIYYFTNARANGLTVTYNSFDLRYPDGPHDAEALLVDDSGRLYVVTKGLSGGAIYAAPEKPTRTAVNELRRVADAPSLVTDGVFLPGGSQLALLTYTSVVVLDAITYDEVSTQPIPIQRQAESLTLNLAGDRLLVGSEGRNSRVYELPLPAGSDPATPASPTPSGGPEDGATAGAGAGDGAEPDLTPDARSRGTYLAVGLAGLVALVAGVVVAAVRKP